MYVKAGLEFWRTGSHARLLSVGTLPLPMDAQTLPLAVWERFGRAEPIDTEKELATVLPWARCVTVLFWSMLLTYGWLIGRQLGGKWGGRLAIAWLACEPNLLAHACLVTADVPMAACLVAFLFHFQRGRESAKWMSRVGWPALWAAIAVLAKLSAIIFGPLCVLTIEIERLIRNGVFRFPAERPRPHGIRDWIRFVWAESRSFRWDYGQVILIATVLVFLFAGSDWRTEDDFVRWAHELPAGPTASAMVWFSESLTIFPNAAEAFVRQVKHNLGGHPSFLLGSESQHGVWYYFPVLLLIKLTIPLLVTIVLTLLTARRACLSWPMCCGLVLLSYSFTFRVQIGVRLVLPAVALLIVGIGIGLGRVLSTSAETTVAMPRVKRSLIRIAAVCIAWAIVRAAVIWPHGLCHINMAWGGTANGYHYVSDSNYDWGQGVPDLLDWQQKQGMSDLAVWYFGTDPAVKTSSLRLVPLHFRRVKGLDDLIHHARSRYLAVGATLAYGGYSNPDNGASIERTVGLLRDMKPADRVGTFLIYDLAGIPGRDERDVQFVAAGNQPDLR